MACDSPHRVAVLDPCGAEVLRYLRWTDQTYYGGTTSDHYRDLVPGAFGPHMWMTLPGMFGLVAEFAALDAGPLPYTLQGGRFGDSVQLGRVMNADRLAMALGCSTEAVCGHFGRLILTREHPWMTH